MFKHTALVTTLIASASTCSAQQAVVPAASAVADTATPGAVARGRLLFLRCASCHEVDDRGVAKTGPTLKGIVGRPVAALPGYDYSAALKARPFVWDRATLDRWLEKPTQVAPETTMVFIGMPVADDRKALIAYLQTL